MTNPTLLPCPFCGGTELSIRTDLQSSIAYVVCSNCDAQGPPASFAEMLWEEEDAAAAWNQRSAWQPIETAPKDGTWVLLAGGECESNEESNNKERVVTAQWTTEFRSSVRSPLGNEFGRWQFAWYDDGFYGEYENPTHWQHLPSPPPITP
jgi:Lar family restriction alleviation protein